MTDEKLIKALSAATLVFTMAAGSAVLWAWQSEARAEDLVKQLTVVKDSQRSAWQKVYDMQDQESDKVEAAESKAAMAQWELEQCKASHEHH